MAMRVTWRVSNKRSGTGIIRTKLVVTSALPLSLGLGSSHGYLVQNAADPNKAEQNRHAGVGCQSRENSENVAGYWGYLTHAKKVSE